MNHKLKIDLTKFNNQDYARGASRSIEAAWLLTSSLLVNTFVPGSNWRAALLRFFGAKIGTGVVLKPSIKIKFPWKLEIGDNCWIGEGVWIDNLATVTIGTNVCISQDAYLCTGNHDWGSTSFSLIVAPITISDNCWIGARTSVAPGTTFETGAVLCMGSVASGELGAWTINRSAPMQTVLTRKIRESETPQ